jgi:uncharacterized protein YkwD
MRNFLIAIILTVAISEGYGQQPFRASAIPKLLEKSKTDSIACIERTASYYFHILLNDYRKEKGLNSLHWNDTLWIAAVNHSLWMSKKDELTHDERGRTPYFSGRHVGDRVLYASEANTHLHWSAENALYNSKTKGKDISTIALNLARHAMEQWKGSPGHNKNMLKANSSSHGVAFVVTTEHIWVTDVFTFNGNGHSKIEFPKDTNFKLRKLKVQ